jgi:4-hydroxymandelate oxidase
MPGAKRRSTPSRPAPRKPSAPRPAARRSVPTRPAPDEPGFSLGDLEEVAGRRLPPRIWSYIEGGAGEERTLRANRESFARRFLRPRVLRDSAEVDLRTTLLGRPVAAPFFIAPTAYHLQIHPDGEAGTARAAARRGILAIFSTLASHPPEAIARASASGPRWFQLYLQPDPGTDLRLVERAERCGHSAIVVTVDTPVLGVRDRQERGGFAIDRSVPIGLGTAAEPPARGFVRGGDRFVLPSVTEGLWKRIDRIRGRTRLPLVVKGILTGEDAREAVEHGAAAVIVSNHGGRQLDGAPATLDVLPEVARAVGSQVEVYLDGGVRRGSDILVALALGARAVGIGRPVLWALGVGGERGVHRYLTLLKNELAIAMLLSGRRTVAEIDGSLVEPSGP